MSRGDRHRAVSGVRRRLTAMRLLLPCLAMLLAAGAYVTVPAQQPRKAQPRVPRIVPSIPGANRNDGSRIFLERADELEARQELPYRILTGDVQFRKQGMFMYCDSAHFNDTEGIIEAFGNVRMQQGDTLFVYADRLYYADSTELATLYSDYGEDVRLINRDVELRTIEFNYDLGLDLGYYEYGGTLIDDRNRLTSRYGEYSPATKEANFTGNVHLVSLGEREEKDLDIRSEALLYNTMTHVAEINEPAIITSRDGVIHTDSGSYNTEADTTVLYNRSLVVADNGNTLTADTLYYDRKAGYGIGHGSVELRDTTNRVMLTGYYGYYNELSDSAVVTGRALAMEYSRPDTLYLHADTIRSRRVISMIQPADTLAQAYADTTHYIVAAPRVRFYRVDLQGLCDTMIFVQRDSILHLHRHPVVWSGERQIFGNVIQVHLNDSTVDWMRLPDFGLTAEQIEPGYYNQLTGKEMYATLENGEMRHLDVSGNVQAVMFPMENDSTYNKVANAESSYMSADFEHQQLQKLKMWPETNGTFTPLYLAKKSLFYLNRFRWYESLRPTGPDDVFNVTQEMIDLLDGTEAKPGNPAKTDRPNQSDLSEKSVTPAPPAQQIQNTEP